jgi:hypothetical protein
MTLTGPGRHSTARAKRHVMNTIFGHQNHQCSGPNEELARVLANRYGDGTVYLRNGASWAVYRACQRLGLISADGFITRRGRELVASYCI